MTALLAVASLGCVSCSREPSPGPQPVEPEQVASEPAGPDVLVLVIDDCGWEDLRPELTPTLANLGTGIGRRYTRFYASPTCSPSRYMLHFGRLPHRAFIGGALREGETTDIGARLGEPSIANEIAKHGYTPAAFGKWHATGSASVEPFVGPLAFGYATWRAGSPANLPMSGGHYDWERVDDGRVSRCRTYTTVAIRDALLEWWNATASPKLAMCSFIAPHEPFSDAIRSGLVPDGLELGSNQRGRYESALAALDTAITQVLDSVDLERTVVLILSDNGTPLECRPPTRAERDYKSTVFEGGVRVPFFAVGAGVVAGTDDSLVQIVDVPATALELAGGTPSPGALVDSISFAATLSGGESNREDAWVQIFRPNNGRMRNLKRNDWALIERDGTKLLQVDAALGLVDLTSDPREKRLEFGLDPSDERVTSRMPRIESLLGEDWRYPLFGPPTESMPRER
ncbi:Arylsulfatase precursor [Planctomycetes bacterium Pla163]|uniref:Arylsulfatase n=1 Tax=Rohdeia mirabilis TaxID=2528008 RepID=A0A518CXD0_9BACT|nr:Arylsulfatase precursor [Planctomycetes bacterium Pla163]